MDHNGMIISEAYIGNQLGLFMGGEDWWLPDGQARHSSSASKQSLASRACGSSISCTNTEELMPLNCGAGGDS